MGINLPENILTAIKILEENGFEAYLIGGCVRDYLLGAEPHDFDITTNALPDETVECFKNFNVIKTGIKHGTVTVVIEGENIEITTYRIDGNYSDSRHPEAVTFSENLASDVKRRDFTINSIAYNPKTGIVDLTAGERDIKNRVISCVGDADTRFNEDALRILRALRFASTLGFEIDEDTSNSIHRNKNNLLNVSSERIFSEFKKLLCGKNAHIIIRDYIDVIGVFIPEILKTVGFEQNNPYHVHDVFMHTVETLRSCEASEVLRLSAFFHDIGKPLTYSIDEKGIGHFYSHNAVSAKIAQDVLLRLKADNKTKEKVALLVLNHDRKIMCTEKAVKRFLASFSFENALLLLELQRCDILAQNPFYSQERVRRVEELKELICKIHGEMPCLSLKTLDLNGNDLKGFGFPEGKIIGELLNKALNAVINGDILNEKSELISYILKL